MWTILRPRLPACTRPWERLARRKRPDTVAARLTANNVTPRPRACAWGMYR
ncbi:hypothetical protein RAA17_21030 [Komagataeibacter rhaeticus]|nr:hypothetical protein [Komagataeibacter rhaeticus]